MQLRSKDTVLKAELASRRASALSVHVQELQGWHKCEDQGSDSQNPPKLRQYGAFCVMAAFKRWTQEINHSKLAGKNLINK